MTASRYLTADDVAEIFHQRRRYVVEQCGSGRWKAGFKAGREWLFSDSDIKTIEAALREETRQSAERAVPVPAPEPVAKPRTRKDRPAPAPFTASNVTPLVAKPRPVKSA
jgi:hypothetical protein